MRTMVKKWCGPKDEDIVPVDNENDSGNETSSNLTTEDVLDDTKGIVFFVFCFFKQTKKNLLFFSSCILLLSALVVLYLDVVATIQNKTGMYYFVTMLWSNHTTGEVMCKVQIPLAVPPESENLSGFAFAQERSFTLDHCLSKNH
jgi:hypothetical protein